MLSGSKMNICLIGDFSGNADEGMKLVAQCLARELAKTHRVLKLDIRKSISFNVFREMNHFRPDILHYVSGPSPFSFIILKALMLSRKIQSGHRVSTVMSATQPYLPLNTASLCRKLKPDLMLTQSDQHEKYFTNLGFLVKSLPNGVDLERFKPVEDDTKTCLRTKYRLDSNAFIVLHVGPIRANRGLDVMETIAQVPNCLVLLVGSTTSPLEHEMHADLVKSGCIVWRKYIQSIQEIYQLSDLYVFPVEDTLGSIDLPLSVLEAMACNLPVITTKFGGFPRLFVEGDGFSYVNDRHEIPGKARIIRDCVNQQNVRTRAKVTPYSWTSIAEILSQQYQELVHDRN
jgi:glycosyltransferase involved in cell wall biosynthesis